MPADTVENNISNSEALAEVLKYLGFQKPFESLTPEEVSLVTEYMKKKQEAVAMIAEIAELTREMEELEDRRLREMFWLPWPMYLR